MNHKLSLLVVALLAIASLSYPDTALAASLQSSTVHIVRAGETLGGIAAQYGVTISAIMRANSLADANRIRIGMRLTIPGRSSPQSPPSSSNPGRSGGCSGYYTVQAGDTPSGIAARCGVSLSALLQANGLSTNSTIYQGQRLVMPGSGAVQPPVRFLPTPIVESPRSDARVQPTPEAVSIRIPTPTPSIEPTIPP